MLKFLAQFVAKSALHIPVRGFVPTKANETDAGYDLQYDGENDMILFSGQRAKLRTGTYLNIPPGYEGQVRGRSGLAAKGIIAHFGTIDAGYVGEVKVLLFNHSDKPYTIAVGSRIAQIVFKPVLTVAMMPVDEFVVTERGSNGFGSSGV